MLKRYTCRVQTVRVDTTRVGSARDGPRRGEFLSRQICVFSLPADSVSTRYVLRVVYRGS
eukprot:9241429-Pyramimonas_sp.AAC.1